MRTVELDYHTSVSGYRPIVSCLRYYGTSRSAVLLPPCITRCLSVLVLPAWLEDCSVAGMVCVWSTSPRRFVDQLYLIISLIWQQRIVYFSVHRFLSDKEEVFLTSLYWISDLSPRTVHPRILSVIRQVRIFFSLFTMSDSVLDSILAAAESM